MVFTLRSHWFLKLFPLILIDRCDYPVLDTQSKSPLMDIDADNKGNILLEYLLKANFAKFFKCYNEEQITSPCNKFPGVTFIRERKGRSFRKLKKKPDMGKSTCQYLCFYTNLGVN